MTEPRYQVQYRPDIVPVEGEVVGEIRHRARNLSGAQLADAKADLRRDKSGEPGWFSAELTQQVGLILAGDVIAVGATQKAGKTSFLLSQLDHLATQGRRVLYFPLEMTPRQARQRWAAARLGFKWDHVASGAWSDLPEGALDALEATMEDCARLPVAFPPDTRATVSQVISWTEWAIAEYRAEVAIIDHFHRLDITGQNYRVAASDAIRNLKTLASETGIRLVVAAQFNRPQNDRLDLIRIPDRTRFKETNAISEEADLTLGLSRMQHRDATTDDLKAVQHGKREVGSVLWHGAMRVNVLDIRRRDLAELHSVRLTVTDQFVRDRHYGE
jgi:replicative DNA helicase